MLPLLTRKATFFLHPEYVVAAKYSGVLIKKLIKTEVIDVEIDDSGTSFDGVVSALSKLLQAPEWGGCVAHIIFSGHFTKLRVSKWNAQLTQAERKVLALHQLQEVYGASSGFMLFMSEMEYGKSSLLFAIDDVFYKKLLQLEQNLNFRLERMSPYFVVMTNFLHKKISHSSKLIVKDESFIYFADLVDGAWEMVRVMAVKNDWQQTIPKILNLVMDGNENSSVGRKVYFHNEHNSSFSLGEIKGLNHEVVELKLPLRLDISTKLNFTNYII